MQLSSGDFFALVSRKIEQLNLLKGGGGKKMGLNMRLSMTTLLMHTVAHSTKPSFRPKTNNQPLKKFLTLALS